MKTVVENLKESAEELESSLKKLLLGMRPDGLETLEVGYFAAAELAGLSLPAWARVVLPDAFSGRTGAHFQAVTWRPPRGGLN